MTATFGKKVRGRLVNMVILCIAVALILFPSCNSRAWAGESEVHKADDASLRADVIPIDTKAAITSVDLSADQPETGWGAALSSLASCATRDVSVTSFQSSRTPKSISRSPENARQRCC